MEVVLAQAVGREHAVDLDMVGVDDAGGELLRCCAWRALPEVGYELRRTIACGAWFRSQDD